MEESANKSFFDDPDWEKKKAPVVPPAWVVQYVQKTGRSMFWENCVHVGGMKPSGYFPMIYRTLLKDGEIITRLCPGSTKPVDGWLY